MALQYLYTCSLNSIAVVVVGGVCAFNWNYPAARKFRIFFATLNAPSGYAFCHLLALSLVCVIMCVCVFVCVSVYVRPT